MHTLMDAHFKDHKHSLHVPQASTVATDSSPVGCKVSKNDAWMTTGRDHTLKSTAQDSSIHNYILANNPWGWVRQGIYERMRQ